MENEKVVVEKKVYDGSDDKALLLVKGSFPTKEENKKYIKELAVAISTVFQKHQVVRLRCIGKGAIGNACYSSAIAHSDLTQQGLDLRSVCSYQTVSFGDGLERTALLLELTDSMDVEPIKI